VYNTVWKM